MTPEQLQSIQQKAESALKELINIINHTPDLSGEIQPLIQSQQILDDFDQLAKSNSEIAEQLLRLALATTVNYHTVVETGRQLAAKEDPS